MITKNDAILIGKQLIYAMNKELAREATSTGRCTVRGVTMSALDNLWYDAFGGNVRAAFQHDKQKYYAAIGW